MAYSIYLVYALLFFLPFERIPSFELHGVTIRISVIILLIGLLTVVPYLFIRKQLTPLSLLDKAIGVFLAIAALSDLLASHHGRSTEVLVFLGAAVTGYVLISRVPRLGISQLTILRVIVGSGLATSLFGIYQFLGDGFGLSNSLTGLAHQYSRAVFGFPRVQSVALEPLYFANFLLLPIFLLCSYLIGQKRLPKWHELGILTLLLTAFILTLSRGGYAAILGGSALLLVILFVRRTVPFKTMGLIASCIIVSLGLSLGSIKAFSGSKGLKTFTSQATVSDNATVAASVTPRTTNFQEAWRLFKLKPVLGWGIGNYGVVNTISPYNPATGYMIVNNQYLETLAETGILGFLALGVVIIAALLALWQRTKSQPKEAWLTIGLAVSLFGILIQYNFLSTIYMIYVWAVLGLIGLLALPSVQGSSEQP